MRECKVRCAVTERVFFAGLPLMILLKIDRHSIYIHTQKKKNIYPTIL